MRKANKLSVIAPTSESMWPASDNKARLLVRNPAINSAKKYTKLIAKAHVSRRVSVCLAIFVTARIVA
jgi:hypothetical protein